MRIILAVLRIYSVTWVRFFTMETRTGRFFGSLVFNYQLFTVNGKPLQFSLHGFGPVQFSDIVRIIEAFGGRLSKPDLPHTLIFVDPTNVSRPSCDHYDIKFLEDSIIAQKLQNLEDYRLSSFVSQKLMRPVIDCESRKVYDDVRSNGSNQSYNEECSTSESDEHFTDRVTIEGIEKASKNRRISTHRRSESSPRDARYLTTDSNSRRKHNPNASLKIKSDVILTVPMINYSTKNLHKNLHKYENSSKEVSSIQNPHALSNMRTSPMEKEKSETFIQHEGYCASDDSRMSESSMKETYSSDAHCDELQDSANNGSYASQSEWSDESFTTLQNRVLKSNRWKKKPVRNFDTESELSEIETRCTTRAVEDDHQDSSDEVNKFAKHEDAQSNTHKKNTEYFNAAKREELNDHSDTSKSSVEDSDSSSLRSIQYNDSKEYSTPRKTNKPQAESQKGRVQCHKYTDDDDRRMIEYVVKKKAISQAGSESIWRNFLKEEGFVGRKPSSNALARHFRYYVVKHYRKYVDDPDDLREFEKLIRQNSWRFDNKTRNPGKRSKNHRYSDEENRRLLKFVVDKNAIDRAAGPAIWKQFLKTETLSEPQPTAGALSMHFKQFLRKYYRNYTDDPSVLEKFEKGYQSEKTIQPSQSVKPKSKKSDARGKSRDVLKTSDRGGRKESGMNGSGSEPSVPSKNSEWDAAAQKIEEALGASRPQHQETPPLRVKKPTGNIEKSKVNQLQKEKPESLKPDATSSKQNEPGKFPNFETKTPNVSSEEESSSDDSSAEEIEESSKSSRLPAKESSPHRQSSTKTPNPVRDTHKTTNNNIASPTVAHKKKVDITQKPKVHIKKNRPTILQKKIPAKANRPNNKRYPRVPLPDSAVTKMPWLKSFKIPRVRPDKVAESNIENKSMDQPKEIAKNGAADDSMKSGSGEEKANVAKNEDSHSSASEASDLSECELSGESFTTQQLRELERYKISSDRSKVDKIPDRDDSADKLDKKDSQNVKCKKDLPENKASLKKADDSDRETAEKINKQKLSDITKPKDSSVDKRNPQYSSSSKKEKSDVAKGAKSASSAPQSLSKEEAISQKETKKPYHKFTEEDNRRIMEYLIEKDGIHRAEGLTIWRQLAADKVLGDVRVTPSELVKHFKRVLKYDYGKYTNDPVILTQCEQWDLNKTCNPWTKEEDKLMIDFLIKNDAIGDVSSAEIWEKLLKGCPLLQKNGRTPSLMLERYNLHLRHNYSEYTDDPSALTKFKDMEGHCKNDS